MKQSNPKVAANITMTLMIIAFLFSATSLHPIWAKREKVKKLFVAIVFIPFCRCGYLVHKT